MEKDSATNISKDDIERNNIDKDRSASSSRGGSLKEGPSLDERQAQEEGKAPTVTRPGGFQNDPDDPTNPNEVRERHNRKLRS